MPHQNGEKISQSILSMLGGGGKSKQRNKSDQLILWPKLEAIPSKCQMLEKKGGKSKLSAHVGAFYSKLDQTPPDLKLQHFVM